MPPTPDRTTIKAAFEALTSRLRSNLVADPPTAAKPFLRVEGGAAAPTAYPRPHLTVYLARIRPIGVTQNDKLLAVTMTLRVVSDVFEVDPHAALLDKIGAIEDFLDSVADGGIAEGAEGFDDRVWTFDFPTGPAGARLATASAAQTFVVKVERQQNREPAS
ncbi:MAG: hypothetical protein IIC51_11005 [Planctomycetes bacterium]|nr:hypothetical protein [Planctomycetota bacterium]